jgi:hypothetical protein
MITMDVNEQIGDSQKGLTSMMRECRLSDIFHHHHNNYPNFETFDLGSKRIDYIIGSASLLPFTERCGYLAFIMAFHLIIVACLSISQYNLSMASHAFKIHPLDIFTPHFKRMCINNTSNMLKGNSILTTSFTEPRCYTSYISLYLCQTRCFRTGWKCRIFMYSRFSLKLNKNIVNYGRNLTHPMAYILLRGMCCIGRSSKNLLHAHVIPTRFVY